MSAADKICALQNVRRFKLVSEDGWHGMTVRPDGGYVSHKDYAALADLADALAQRITAAQQAWADYESATTTDAHWAAVAAMRAALGDAP